MQTTFLERLNDFAHKLGGDFEDINFGGCCCVSVAFAKHLSQYFPNTKILVANYGWASNEAQNLLTLKSHLQSNTLKEWNKNGVYFAHVIVEIECDGITYQLDTEEGLVKRTNKAMGQYPILSGHLSIEEAEQLADDVTGWNARFDRKQLPRIYATIDKFFRKNKFKLH